MAYKYNPFSGELDKVLGPGRGTATIEFSTDSGTANPTGAGVITIAGGTSIDTSGAGSTVTITFDQIIPNTNGIDYNPGSDIDCDIITVGVTGSPTFSWYESGGGFKINGGAGLIIGAEGDLSHTVNGATVNSELELHSADSQDLGGLSLHRHTNTAQYGGHVTNLRANGTFASPLIVTDGDTIARYVGAGYDGTDYALCAEMRIEVDGTPGNNDMPGRFIWATSADGTQSPVEGMRLDNAQVLTLANALTVPNGGTGATTLTDHGVLLGSGTSAVTVTSVGTDGQLLIGATGADPAFASLTSTGGTVSFTAGTNSLNLEVSSGGFTWTDVTGTSDTMVAQNGYVANNAGLVTLTLPASSTIGDTFKVITKGAGLVRIAQNASQSIQFAGSTTTTGAGGSLTATAVGDTLEIISTADDEFYVVSSIGSWTVV